MKLKKIKYIILICIVFYFLPLKYTNKLIYVKIKRIYDQPFFLGWTSLSLIKYNNNIIKNIVTVYNIQDKRKNMSINYMLYILINLLIYFIIKYIFRNEQKQINFKNFFNLIMLILMIFFMFIVEPYIPLFLFGLTIFINNLIMINEININYKFLENKKMLFLKNQKTGKILLILIFFNTFIYYYSSEIYKIIMNIYNYIYWNYIF